MPLIEVQADVDEHDEDQLAMYSREPRWRSMMIKQSIEGASVDVRGAANVSDATGGIVAADETIAPNMNYRREDPGQWHKRGSHLDWVPWRRGKRRLMHGYRGRAPQLRICSSPQEMW